jgi:hypothetical protein
MSANETQVGGNHYQSKIQHWDYVIENDLDYFQAQITKYVTRWKKKNGTQDLKKARHFLEKYMELIEEGKIVPPLAKIDTSEPLSRGYVDQDRARVPIPAPNHFPLK